MAQQLILVTGAARCGKSEWAESLAIASDRAVTYIATATVDPADPEWQARIDRHQQRRPATWQTMATVEDLAQQIEGAEPTQCLLIDSLGTWVANLLDRSDVEWEKIAQALLAVLPTSRGTIIMVAEETGWGVVPAYPSGRLFRDRLGMLTRQIGSISSTVYLVTGGHVLNLSQLGQKLDR
ncbi:bifunctional adenosylcobinamide kinase/adenosylcobinamide-phosphate guanylyltransferase [Chamaesiphon sp. VAR_69_metabat_338]|uniref:bifunctional adenosylcobinamide kinase/adenosylcobinamide-phosphate guanylyltransferase n=1 Tax=Chamaesiphon sp. VAR_69_metabat_338 TaxID=2964704 RepID=UPI00286E67D8|nr:bifunctional adenosylcobinamide kinase/adenosylcobinamide-phosphate guanylyltransferase [Chamaesiphon sp. VAR_69_metabat_338]